MDLGNADYWHQVAYPTPLRSYQLDYVKGLEAVVAASLRGEIPPRLSITNIWSRQSGKNHSNACAEARLLSVHAQSKQVLEIVKCAPTWKPQCLISKERLKRVTNTPLFNTLLKPQWSEGFVCTIGNASMKLVSADPKANNVGLTASLLLSVDEAQHIAPEKFDVNFRPMCLDTGAPITMSGTSWRMDSLLERNRAESEELEKKLGIRLTYIVPWDVVAADEEARFPGRESRYGAQVKRDIARYGEDHILIQTQYCCKPVEAAGMFFTSADIATMMGNHQRGTGPTDGRVYVAGVDFAGADEQNDEDVMKNDQLNEARDSTVVTIAELIFHVERDTGRKLPMLRVVDHLHVKDMQPLASVDTIFRYVFEHWQCVHAVLDVAGVGDMPAKIIKQRRQQQCTTIHPSGPSKSRLGFDLMAAAKTGRVQLYRCDDSPEWHENFFQLRQCRRHDLREGQMMKWGHPKCKVDGRDVHDDYVLSLAYCLEAGWEHLAQHDPDDAGNKEGLLDDWTFDAFTDE